MVELSIKKGIVGAQPWKQAPTIIRFVFLFASKAPPIITGSIRPSRGQGVSIPKNLIRARSVVAFGGPGTYSSAPVCLLIQWYAVVLR